LLTPIYLDCGNAIREEVSTRSTSLLLTINLTVITETTRNTPSVESLEDLSEGRAPPAPGVVDDDFGRVGDEWSVVCVELARLVRRTSPLPVWTHESRVC